jgi:SNF2 family DNA or RNA helicase
MIGLLQQWKEEIESKTQGKLSVYLYHGPDKTRSLKELRRYDVVLTTLTTMSREWVPDDSIALKRKKAAMKKKGHEWTEDDDIRWHEDLHQDGVLFKITWHRIVIEWVEASNPLSLDY